MRRQVVCAVVTSTAALLLGSSAWAAGAAVNETGARGTGMANAVTAIADRAQALPHNPAGIAQLTGLQIDASVAMILPSPSTVRLSQLRSEGGPYGNRSSKRSIILK